MNFFTGILIGLREIWAHKMRSLLTLLGVILGVASLVSMIGLVRGAFAVSKTWIQEMGGMEKISVMEDTPATGPRHLQAMSKGRTMQDVRAIEQACPLAVWVSPEVDFRGTIQRGGKTFDTRAQGVREDILAINNYEVAEGRFIGALDLERYANVAVIGTSVIKELYEPQEPAVGTMIKLNGLPFTVIGVLKHYQLGEPKNEKDRNPLEWKNRIIFIPLTTAQKKLTGKEELTWLNAKVLRFADVGRLAEQVENILLHTHRGIKDFRVETMEKELAEFKRVENAFTISLGGVAAISLLIGGIGIMNVMLASINERIREIGIRKAVGARDWDLFTQFVAESVALSFVGGLLGLLAGAGLIVLLGKMLAEYQMAPVLSADALVIGFLFSVCVGVLSGLYPAVRAARLDPIEALRYE